MISSGTSENSRKQTVDTEDGQNCGATLVGLRADPTSSPEDWESDFDFDSTTTILPPPATRGAGLDPSPAAGSSPRVAITVSERRDLEELLKTLPTYSQFSEKLATSSLLQNLPAISKLGIKDLLREMQHTASFLSDPLSDLQSGKGATDSPKANVESHEWNMTQARGKNNLQVFYLQFSQGRFINL